MKNITAGYNFLFHLSQEMITINLCLKMQPTLFITCNYLTKTKYKRSLELDFRKFNLIIKKPGVIKHGT